MPFDMSILGAALSLPSLFCPSPAYVAPAVDDPPMGVVDTMPGSWWINRQVVETSDDPMDGSYATLDIEMVDLETAMFCDVPASPTDIEMVVFDSSKAIHTPQAVRRPVTICNDVWMKDAFCRPLRPFAKTRYPRPVPMDVDSPEAPPPPSIVLPMHSPALHSTPIPDSLKRRWSEGLNSMMNQFRETKRRRVQEGLVREGQCHVLSCVHASIRCSRLSARHDEGHKSSLRSCPYRLPSPPPSRWPTPPPARMSSPTPAARLPSPVASPIPPPYSPVLYLPSTSHQHRLPTDLFSFGLRSRLPTVEQHILSEADMERIGNDYADNLEWVSLKHDESSTEQEKKFSEEDIFGSDSDEEGTDENAGAAVESDATEQVDDAAVDEGSATAEVEQENCLGEQDMEFEFEDDDSEDDDSDAGEDVSYGLDFSLGDSGFEDNADAVPDADPLSPSSLLQQADNFLWDVLTSLHAHQIFPGTGT